MQEWDTYWAKAPETHNRVYDAIAVFYRRYIIRPYLRRYFSRYFSDNAMILHAGCGGGQVEEGITGAKSVIGLDISANALSLYRKTHPDADLVRGDVTATAFRPGSFDAIYNLGVMEHFSEGEIHTILLEFRRILNDDGTIVLFWPPRYGLTVLFLKGVHYCLNEILSKDVQLHPPEPTLIRSEDHARHLAAGAGFRLVTYDFSIRDGFTYAVLILKKG